MDEEDQEEGTMNSFPSAHSLEPEPEWEVSRLLDTKGFKVQVEWEGGDVTWEPFVHMFEDVPAVCQRDLPGILARKKAENPDFVLESVFRNKINMPNELLPAKKKQKSNLAGVKVAEENSGDEENAKDNAAADGSKVTDTTNTEKVALEKSVTDESSETAANESLAVSLPTESKSSKPPVKTVTSLAKTKPSTRGLKQASIMSMMSPSKPSKPTAIPTPTKKHKAAKPESSNYSSDSDSSASSDSSDSESSSESDDDDDDDEEEEEKEAEEETKKKPKPKPKPTRAAVPKKASKEEADAQHARTHIGVAEVEKFFAAYPQHKLAMFCPYCETTVQATGSQKPMYSHFCKCLGEEYKKVDKSGNTLFKCPICQGAHQAFFPPFMVHLSKHWGNSRHIAECPESGCTFGSANMKKLVEHWMALCPIRFPNKERKAQSHVLGKEEIGDMLTSRNEELAHIKAEALPALPTEIPKEALGSTTIASNPIALTISHKIGLPSLEAAIAPRFPTKLPENITPTKTGIVLVLGRSGTGKSMLLRQLAKNSGIAFDPGSEVCMAQPGWVPNRCVVSHFPQDAVEGGSSKIKSKDKLEEGGLANQAHLYLMGIGLSSIPAWTQPYKSLSQGERYRADLARMICRAEQQPTTYASSWKIIDEFTSCLDRTTARSVAASLGRMLRDRKHTGWVVASANADIVNWLQPDVVIALSDSGEATFVTNSNNKVKKPDVLVRLDLDQCAGLGGGDEAKGKKKTEEKNTKLIYSTLATYESVFGGTATETEADRWRGLRVLKKSIIADYPVLDDSNDEAKASKAVINKRAQDEEILRKAKAKKLTTHLDCTVLRDRAYLEVRFNFLF